MPDPFLYADTIRFGEEEAARMHALGTEKPKHLCPKCERPLTLSGDCAHCDRSEPVVLHTHTLQLIGPPWTVVKPVDPWGWLRPGLLAETEENLTDLLPAGYSVRIQPWDEEEA